MPNVSDSEYDLSDPKVGMNRNSSDSKSGCSEKEDELLEDIRPVCSIRQQKCGRNTERGELHKDEIEDEGEDKNKGKDKDEGEDRNKYEGNDKNKDKGEDKDEDKVKDRKQVGSRSS